MCNAFSCIVTKDKKVYWKFAMDSHDEIIKEFKLEDNTDNQEQMQFARVEISPKNNDYLKPRWQFKIDETITPEWFSPAHKQKCIEAHKEYKKQLYSILIRKKIIHPFKLKIHPFKLKSVKKVTLKQKLLLKEWDSVRNSVETSVRTSVGSSVGSSVRDSVRDSVRNSVWDSVWDSVETSVRDSVWYSVRDSVWDSVRNSVESSVWDSVWDSAGGYFGSFFKLERKQWKYTKKIKTKGYPFQSVVDLWEQGLVPSFDGATWRLHTGKKAKIIFEIKATELRKLKVN